MDFTTIVVISWLLCSILGAAMLSRYNKAGTGFLLGLFLGYFGLLFALVIRSGENKKIEQRRHDEQLAVMRPSALGDAPAGASRECPFCAETILAKAKFCKHCHKEVEPAIADSSHTSAEEAMQAHGITFDGEKYRFGVYRYDKLSDAIAYASQAHP